MDFAKKIRVLIFATLKITLCLVFIFNVLSGSFHKHEETSLFADQICSGEKELDPCHRYLVHHEESTDCNGSHLHFQNKEHECFFCKHFKERINYIVPNFVLLNLSSHFTEKIAPEPFVFKILHLSSYLRGPPLAV